MTPEAIMLANMRTQSDQARLDAMSQKEKLARTTYLAFRERGNILRKKIGTHNEKKVVCMYVTNNEMPRIEWQGKKIIEHHTMRFLNDEQQRLFREHVYLY